MLALNCSKTPFLKINYNTIWYDFRTQKMFAVFGILFGAAMAQTADYCAVETCQGRGENTLCTFKVSRLAKF